MHVYNIKKKKKKKTLNEISRRTLKKSTFKYGHFIDNVYCLLQATSSLRRFMFRTTYSTFQNNIIISYTLVHFCPFLIISEYLN